MRKKKILIISTVAITVPILVVSAGVGWTVCWDYVRYSHLPALSFDAGRWKDDVKYRHVVTSSIANRVIRKGFSKAEVKEILGPPDYWGAAGSWTYRTKKPGYHPDEPEGGGLQLDFDRNDRVSTIIDDRWVQ